MGFIGCSPQIVIVNLKRKIIYWLDVGEILRIYGKTVKPGLRWAGRWAARGGVQEAEMLCNLFRYRCCNECFSLLFPLSLSLNYPDQVSKFLRRESSWPNMTVSWLDSIGYFIYRFIKIIHYGWKVIPQRILPEGEIGVNHSKRNERKSMCATTFMMKSDED